MKNLHPIFFLALFACIGSQVLAQAASVVLPIDSVVPWITRTPDGGYLARHGNQPSVVKFDANMQQLWAVDMSNGYVQPNTPTYYSPLPDNGVIAIGPAGAEDVGKDSVRSRIFVDRIDPMGNQVFAKFLYFPVTEVFSLSYWETPYSLFGNPVAVDQQSESFISLGDYAFNPVAKILKLGTDGLPQWITELDENQILMGELTPDDEGGCYFASQVDPQYNNMAIGHILNNGTLDWCNTYSRYNSGFFGGFHLRVAANGHLVAAGMEGNNLFWMELGPTGAVINYHLVAQVPAVPINIQDGLEGFDQLANGEWVALHGGALNSRLTFFNEDGTWSRSYDEPRELHGSWYEQLFWRGLSTLDSELTVYGVFRRQEAVFNFWEERPTLTTFPQGPLTHCLLAPGNAAQTSIPAASITVVPNPDFLTALPVPTVVDTVMQLTPGGNWPSTDLCELATSITDPDASNSGIRLLGNPVASGGNIVLETDMPVTVVVMDLTGRPVTGKSSLERGRVEVPAIGLAAGVYLVSARDRTGTPVFTQPVVVQ